MGIFRDYHTSKHNNHFYEIESRGSLAGAEYSLTIDNKKQDQIFYGFWGKVKLRTQVQNGDGIENVVVDINQRLFSTEFTLFVNDVRIQLEKVY